MPRLPYAPCRSLWPGRACPSARQHLPASLNPYRTLCIEEVDTALSAGELKLALGEYYPDEYPLWFCTLGEAGYTVRSIRCWSWIGSVITMQAPACWCRRPSLPS